MSKRFYFEITAILIASLLLLGFSFSRESGTNSDVVLSEYNDGDLRIVYENKKYMSMDNSGNHINVINKSDREITYEVSLVEINGKEYKDVSYSLGNDEGFKKLDGNIMELKLSPYGTNGDSAIINLKISTTDPELFFKLDFNEHKPNLFIDTLMKDPNVYLDSNGGYRYFGTNVNNYLRYHGDLYRIVGYMDGGLLIITDEVKLTRYGNGDNYLSLHDYLSSFENRKLTVDEAEGKKTWLTEDHDYWLKDLDGDFAYYADKINGIGKVNSRKMVYDRFVERINGVLVLNKGDGSINNPYEVSYGS